MKTYLDIVFLTAAGPWSGAEVHTRQLATTLQDRGHSVTIVDMGKSVYGSASLPPGISVISLSSLIDDAPAWQDLKLGQWRHIFRQLDPDITVLVKGNFELGTAALGTAARLESRAYLTIEHMHAPLGKRPPTNLMLGRLPNIGLWWYKKRISGFFRCAFPSKIVCVSGAVNRTLHLDYRVPSSKLITAYTGIDTCRFAPDPRARQALRRDLKIGDSAFVFGTLGRLSPMKNQELLISAFAEIYRKTERDVELIIVGDGPLRAKLEARAKELDIMDKVHFLDFSATPENVYPAFDVFCLTSTGEALPIVLLEAMSCGTPSIATAVGGVPEIILDQNHGYLIPSNEPIALEIAMTQVLELDTHTLAAFAETARRRIAESFDARDCFGELAAAIEERAGEQFRAGYRKVP